MTPDCPGRQSACTQKPHTRSGIPAGPVASRSSASTKVLWNSRSSRRQGAPKYIPCASSSPHPTTHMVTKTASPPSHPCPRRNSCRTSPSRPRAHTARASSTTGPRRARRSSSAPSHDEINRPGNEAQRPVVVTVLLEARGLPDEFDPLPGRQRAEALLLDTGVVAPASSGGLGESRTPTPPRPATHERPRSPWGNHTGPRTRRTVPSRVTPPDTGDRASNDPVPLLLPHIHRFQRPTPLLPTAPGATPRVRVRPHRAVHRTTPLAPAPAPPRTHTPRPERRRGHPDPPAPTRLAGTILRPVRTDGHSHLALRAGITIGAVLTAPLLLLAGDSRTTASCGTCTGTGPVLQRRGLGAPGVLRDDERAGTGPDSADAPHRLTRRRRLRPDGEEVVRGRSGTHTAQTQAQTQSENEARTSRSRGRRREKPDGTGVVGPRC